MSILKIRHPELLCGSLLALISVSALAQLPKQEHGNKPEREKGVMLMNRIGPSTAELFVANADGSAERKLFPVSGFDYHASYSPDGKWIVFTSERNGSGQADIYRCHPDGTGLERFTDSPALDDQGTLSPDGTELAFVSTRDTHKANIWILDMRTRRLRNLTGSAELQGDPEKPDGQEWRGPAAHRSRAV